MGQPIEVIQSVFNRGELSPRIIGRLDLDAYYNALKYSSNFIPFPQGAITKRMGTYYVARVKDSSKATRLIPFRFSTVQNYIIEAGDLYFRFYRNRGQIESSPSVPYELVTPWPSSVVSELKYVQSYDRLYVFHKDYQTRVITRTSDTSWTINTLTFIDGPYLPINTTTTTMTPSVTTGSGTMTASSAVFVAGDVGRQIRLKNGATYGWATITGYTSSTVVNITVGGAFAATTANATWSLSHFGGDMGWPSVGTIYEQRMIMASTVNYPATLFGTITGGFGTSATFSPSQTSGTVTDSDGFVYTIGDDQVNKIEWLSSGKTLLIGTSGAEHSMTGGTSSSYAPITPSNVTIKRESKIGSRTNVRAHRVGNAVLYISKSGLKCRELNYDFSIDSYISRDVTIFNNHITDSGVIDCDFQDEPDPTLWCVRTDGKVIGFSYERQQEVEGWHRHTFGGTDVQVKSVACIGKPDTHGDDVWFIVSRTVNGATVQTIEYLYDYFEPETNADKSDAFFVDCGLSYDGRLDATLTPSAVSGSGVTFTASAAVFSSGMVGDQIRYGTSRAIITGYVDTTHVTADISVSFPDTNPIPSGDWSLAIMSVAGLDHLEGETVSVCADGYSAGTYEVVSGSIDLPDFASVVHAGLGYASELHTLPVEVKQLGTIAGRIRRTHKLFIYLTNTIGLILGNNKNSTIEVVPFGGGNENLNEGPSLFNGVIEREPPVGYDKEGVLRIYHDYPTNITVNYIAQKLSING